MLCFCSSRCLQGALSPAAERRVFKERWKEAAAVRDFHVSQQLLSFVSAARSAAGISTTSAVLCRALRGSVGPCFASRSQSELCARALGLSGAKFWG